MLCQVAMCESVSACVLGVFRAWKKRPCRLGLTWFSLLERRERMASRDRSNFLWSSAGGDMDQAENSAGSLHHHEQHPDGCQQEGLDHWLGGSPYRWERRWWLIVSVDRTVWTPLNGKQQAALCLKKTEFSRLAASTGDNLLIQNHET